MSIAPEDPSTHAGKMYDQYLLGLSANAKSVVATMQRHSPNRIIHFGLMTRESDPVKLIANANAPFGILPIRASASEE